MKFLLPLFLTCLYSCNKSKVNPTTLIKTPVDSTKPRIIIAENIEGTYLDSISKGEKSIDTLIEDNSFMIYKSPGSSNYNPVTITFKINLPETQIDGVTWKIGNDTTGRNTPKFNLDFYQPTSTPLTAKLVIKWHYPLQIDKNYTDTISKTFIVNNTNKLFGSYTGSDRETPGDIYTIIVGEHIDSSFEFSTNPIHVFGTKNLWKGYPYTMYIGQPKTNGFTTFVTGEERQRIKIDNIYYSNPYTLANLNKNKDSIYIQYSYYRFVAGSRSLIDKVITRNFRGKKD